MTFVYEALEDKPDSIYPMDTASPFQDYSGNGRAASFSGGTPVKHPSIVWGTSYANCFTNAIQVTYSTPLFSKTKEQQPFTLEAWVRKSGTSTMQQILGHNSTFDGLCIEGTIVYFRIKFTDGTTAEASFDTQRYQVLHVVGVKNELGIYLYINGEMVGQTEFTESQIASEYSASNGSLYSGYSQDPASAVAVSGVALYASALSSDAVARHYWAGNLIAPVESMVYAGYGEDINLGWQQFSVFARETWDDEESFTISGESIDVSIRNDTIVPNLEGDFSVPGIWKTSFDLDSSDLTSIYGVQIDWDGKGIVVEASLDGDSWFPVVRNSSSSIVPNGTNPLEKELQIAVTFPGGVDNDQSYLKSLTVTGYSSATNSDNEARTITLSSALPAEDKPVREFHEDWGIRTSSGGSVTISPDKSESTELSRSIELWIRPVSSVTISVTGTMYQNGVANANALPTGVWTLVHIVPTSEITTNTVISGAFQLGSVAYYPTALSANDVARLYSFYSGASPIKFAETQSLVVAEPTNTAAVYSHDWYVQGAV